MAKGLSILQKTILLLAIRNFGDRTKNYEVNNREVLIEYYGFEPCCNIEGKRNGTKIFDRRVIGINRVRSASVAVVKAFDRLVDRGFARRKHNYGIILTEVGTMSPKAIASNLICSKEKLNLSNDFDKKIRGGRWVVMVQDIGLDRIQRQPLKARIRLTFAGLVERDSCIKVSY
jgi:hypothetical protein